MSLSEIQKQLLREVADLENVPKGAYNILSNGESAGRSTTANIDKVTKYLDGFGALELTCDELYKYSVAPDRFDVCKSRESV